MAKKSAASKRAAVATTKQETHQKPTKDTKTTTEQTTVSAPTEQTTVSAPAKEDAPVTIMPQ